MQPERDVRVCFLGDSFVVGVGDPSALGWVGRVSAAAAAQGKGFTAYNLGVRGQTSVDIADRAAAEVTPRLAAAQDARVVVSFGVNDSQLIDGHTRVDPIQTLVSLRRIGREIGNARVLVVGPPAVLDAEQNVKIEAISAALKGEANAARIPFVEVYSATAEDGTWRRELESGDGDHPGEDGYRLLTSLIEPAILDWLD